MIDVVIGWWWWRAESDVLLRMSMTRPSTIFVDLSRQRIVRGGREFRFSSKVFVILAALAARRGGWCDYEGLADYVIGDDPEGGPMHIMNCISVQLAKNRARLRDLGLGVESWNGVGMRLFDYTGGRRAA